MGFFKNTFLFVVIGCSFFAPFSLGAAQAEGAAEESAYEGSYIRRPTLVISNMDASLALYRDILGFRLGSLKQDPPDSYVFPAFNIPDEAIVMHATLDSDDEKRTLSLVEYKDLAPIDATDSVRRAAVLVNANGRFDAIKAELKDNGFDLLSQHPLGGTGVEMGFLDPDGHLIVIYEFPKQ